MLRYKVQFLYLRQTKSTMKNLKPLLILLLLLSLAGCSSDDNKEVTADASQYPELILGKWYHDSSIFVKNGPINIYQNQCAGQRDYQEFLQGGTARDVVYNASCQINSNAVAQWKIEGTSLNFTYGEESDLSYEIVKLTENQLHLKKDDVELFFVKN